MPASSSVLFPGAGQEIQKNPERTMQLAKQEFEHKLRFSEAFFLSRFLQFSAPVLPQERVQH